MDSIHIPSPEKQSLDTPACIRENRYILYQFPPFGVRLRTKPLYQCDILLYQTHINPYTCPGIR